MIIRRDYYENMVMEIATVRSALKAKTDEYEGKARECEKLKAEVAEREADVKKLKSERDAMAGKLRIYAEHYRVDQEPTTDEAIAVRVNLRIHELELELAKERQLRLELLTSALATAYVGQCSLSDYYARQGA